MRKRPCMMFLAVLIFMTTSISGLALAQNSQEHGLVVVASDSCFETAKNWVSFLQNQSIIVKHVLPGEFEKYNKEKNLVVMAVPGEQGGAGDVLKSILTKDELDWVSQQGNKKLYTKNNVFEKDQTIFVFVAYTRDAITTAIRDSKDTWWETIMSWFDIEMEPTQVRGY